MTEMFSTLGTWNWLIFGFVLMSLELLAPGVFMFWLGLAALLVGLISFVIHPSWQLQLLMFAAFAVAAVPLWRRLARQKPGENSNPTSNAASPSQNRNTPGAISSSAIRMKPKISQFQVPNVENISAMI